MFSRLAATPPPLPVRPSRRWAGQRTRQWLITLLMLLACAATPRPGHAAPSSVPVPTPAPAAEGGLSPAPPPGAAAAETAPGIAPPLSIYESCLMAAGAARLLAQPAPTTATLRQADRMLQAVILYVDRIDRAHSTLPFYAWETVSAEKAPREGWETQVLRLLTPMPQVTALSIRARHGDLDIKSLTAVDRNRTCWEFNQAVHVPADQPRPEIFFLSLPTELTELRVTCRRSDPKTQRWPRLFIDAGVSSIPESAKQAIYYLRVARGDIQARQLNNAGQHLRQAGDHLRDYLKNRRF